MKPLKHFALRPATSLALAVFAGAAMPAWGQQVILDNQVRAGDLNLFQSLSAPNDYYYAPTEARLGVQPGGTPSFSFTRYISPNVSATAANDSGNAIGVVHAVVELGVTDEQLEDAREALREVVPAGRIVGPLTFQSGTFALISSYSEPGSDTTLRVAGVGNMPLLEGDRAAVSLRLTSQGTVELWESFNRATPDISFSFNAEIDGYRSPKKALIEADFDRIYSHKAFEAGIASPYLQAEIEAAFDDLRRTGAIRLTQVGDDENLQELVDAAYTRLIDIIFESSESTGIDSVNELATAARGDEDSMLERASTLLTQRTEAIDERNEAIRERNSEREAASAAAAENESSVGTTTRDVTRLEESESELRERAEALRITADYENDPEDKQVLTTQADRYDTLAGERETELGAARTRLADQQRAAASANARELAAGEPEEEESDFPIAIVASFRMKEVKESGSYRIDLNKYTADTLSLRFDQNIGDLSGYMNNPDVFATVDLADTALRQREVPVFIDGLNAEDFGQYINFATIVLRKQRPGTETFAIDEVRVDRENFRNSANNFKLVYNKLSDGNQADFLQYDYRVLWNFFGGAELDQPWTTTDRSGIAIAPPYQRRTIFLEADPARIATAGVRAIEVTVYYSLGGVEKSKKVSLTPRSDGQGLSQQVEFMLPDGNYQYAYEISWRMGDGSRRSSGRVTSADGTLFIDEIPGA